MSNNQNSYRANAILRNEKRFQYSWIIALVSSIAIGFHIFILAGWIDLNQMGNGEIVYFVSAIVYLLILLPFVEFSSRSVKSEQSGFVSILKKKKTPALLFWGSWILILGFVSSISLFSRSIGQFLSVFFENSILIRIDNILLFSFVGLGIACIFSFLRPNQPNYLYTILFFASLIIVLMICLFGKINSLNMNPISVVHGKQLWSFVAYTVPGLWGISLLLDFKNTIPKLKKNFPATLLVIFILGLLGGGLILLRGCFPNIWILDQQDNINFSKANFPHFMTFSFLLSGIVTLLGGLVGVLDSFSKVVSDLFMERVIPCKNLFFRNSTSVNLFCSILIFSICIVIGVLFPYWLLISLSSIGFLWFTAILNASEFQNLNIGKRGKNDFQLPFFPLFPGLALVISLLLSLTLPILATSLFLIWLCLGFLFYKFYYSPNRSVIRESKPISDGLLTSTDEIDNYDVLVLIQDPYSAVSLIRAGAYLANDKSARLLVMQPISISVAFPEAYRRQEAQNQLTELFGYIERAKIFPEVSIIPIVDITENLESSILDLIEEENVGLVVLNWKQENQKKGLEQIWNKLLDSEVESIYASAKNSFDIKKILRNIPCDVIVFRGKYDGTADRIIIPILKKIPLRAYKFGLEISKDKSIPLVFLNPIENSIISLEALGLKQEAKNDVDRVSLKNIGDNDLDAAIKKYAEPEDLVLLETDAVSFFDIEIFDELIELFQAGKQKATFLYRSSNKVFRLQIYRAWFYVRNLFPSMSAFDKTTISTKIREAAKPSVDYFMLIILAASIATLGLLADSTAVIIGAMLVAPLMSPIISTAMGIVQGDTVLIRLASEASLKGIALAIGVGALITIVFPDHLTTNAILARTHPNLLDLFVALASGAAAGYALSRENVSAALPGVSIAVALVPPLCVVGYGLATTDFQISGGAFLLFITNVVAIILAAATIFLLLGFRPLKYQDSLFQRSFLIFVVSFAVISVPLTYFLLESIQNTTLEHNERLFSEQVEIFLENEIQKENGDLLDIEFEKTNNGYLIDATFLVEDYDDISIPALENSLGEKFRKNIKLQARILNAEFIH